MFSQVGSIVLIKNVIFKRSNTVKKNYVDHAFKSGRPAIVICETDEKMYHLLLTHSCHHKRNMGNYLPFMSYSDKYDGFIDLSEIHVRPLCHERELEYVNDEYLLWILKSLCSFQDTNETDPEYEKIRALLYDKIDDLCQNGVKCLKKEKK